MNRFHFIGEATIASPGLNKPANTATFPISNVAQYKFFLIKASCNPVNGGLILSTNLGSNKMNVAWSQHGDCLLYIGRSASDYAFIGALTTTFNGQPTSYNGNNGAIKYTNITQILFSYTGNGGNATVTIYGVS